MLVNWSGRDNPLTSIRNDLDLGWTAETYHPVVISAFRRYRLLKTDRATGWIILSRGNELALQTRRKSNEMRVHKGGIEED